MTTKLDQYICLKESSIADAFKKIDLNASGAVFVTDDKKRVCGIATDGDIRRYLLKNNNINHKISLCMNTSFSSVQESTPREIILKKLDEVIKVLPVLSDDHTLIDVLTRSDFPLRKEKGVIARAKSPVRISFSGGGSDLTHFFSKFGGAVMNATIKMHSHATLKKRHDGITSIYSGDFDEHIEGSSLEELKKNEKFKLIISAIELIAPKFNFHLDIHCDFPIGSGLGGSAVVLSSIIGCFNQFREDKWDRYEIAELAFQAERISLDVAGGWQDQYATVFGGFNFMEFNAEQNVVHPFRIDRNTILELEENLILCYSNTTRNSGNIINEQKKNIQQNDSLKQIVQENKNLAYKLKSHLLRGHLSNFGAILDSCWNLKRKLSKNTSNSDLDDLYNLAKENGALGGKILGAGGGGYFLFYVEPLKKQKLRSVLIEKGLHIAPVYFDHDGLQAWSIREYQK